MKKLILLFLFTSLFASIIVKPQNLKSSYFENQMATLDFRIVLSSPNNITVLENPRFSAKLKKINDYLYTLKITTQISKKMPKVVIVGKKLYYPINLNKYITVSPLPKSQNFSRVIATDLKIKNVISSKYNKNSNIVSFDITCKNCNLKDFSLPFEQNLTLKSKNLASYYVILPNTIKRLHFYYFNSNLDSFVPVNIPIILKNETISTQTNINPEENQFFTPLNILLIIAIIFSIIVFLVYRKFFLLIPTFALLALLVYPYIPKGNVYLPKGTKVYILPTKQSTVIYITKYPEEAKKLKSLRNYTKIQIDNKIGWVRNDSY